MIDDKQLIWDRLKGNTELALKVDMEVAIGRVFDKHKEEINKILYDYVSWAITRYSITEIRTAFDDLVMHHPGLMHIIDYNEINKLDERLELNQAKSDILFKYIKNHIKNKPSLPPLPSSNHSSETKSEKSKKLKQLLKKLKGQDNKKKKKSKER